MAANLAENVKNVLQRQPVKSLYGWLDSTVALYWIKGGGGSTYKQFVANRAQKIREKDFIAWRHEGTSQNLADIGSRGCVGDKLLRLWLKGPEWLADPKRWPPHLLMEPTQEMEAEAKITKELFRTAVQTKNELDDNRREAQPLDNNSSNSMDQGFPGQLPVEQRNTNPRSFDDG